MSIVFLDGRLSSKAVSADGKEDKKETDILDSESATWCNLLPLVAVHSLNLCESVLQLLRLRLP